MAFIFKNLSLSSSVFFYAIPLLLSYLFMVSHSHYLTNPTPFSSINATTSNVSAGGQWLLLHNSIGVSAMHMQLLKNDKVILFDRTDMGPSNFSFPSGTGCRQYIDTHHRNRTITDCTAHSLQYDVISGNVRPLYVSSDTWCSSGAVDPNGTLIQTGGYGSGIRKIRTFAPCDDGKCEWTELPVNLTDGRWYASTQILPDGRVIVVGGRRAFSYEFYPKTDDVSSKRYYLSFLEETTDPYEENNLYPFLHLLPDGNLFIFANNRSILLDYKQNRVVKELPVIPDGIKRTYPSTGSSVLLPLKMNGSLDGSDKPEAEVLICGGSPPGAFNMSNLNRVFVSASNSCGRIKLTDPDPKWVMEEMPMPRVMSDMLLLPTGDVIILNGASNGTAGWEDAANPVFNPVLYKTYEPDPNLRFVVLNPSSTARMYHSSALLLPDGRILVGGSNPHEVYNFTAKPFPTDLSLEAYQPPYLGPIFAALRPSILTIEARDSIVSYGQMFSVTFMLSLYRPDPGISVVLITPSFTTHSLAMNQRMVVLDVARLENLSAFAYKIAAYGPPKTTVAPPGYYMLFLVHAGTPSHAVWVKVQ
ncbi:hypothetical protein ACE6H2_002809 [Prunus campanulata]